MDTDASILSWGEEVRALGISMGIALSDDEIEYILWEKTSFPLGTTNKVLEQVFQWISQRYPEFEQKRLI